MTPWLQDPDVTIWNGDALEVLRDLPDECVDCCVTSPPYWGLRDYGHDEQIGLEPTPEEYMQQVVDVFREVRRCLVNTGTLWLNLGDSYAGNGGTNAAWSTPLEQSKKRSAARSLPARLMGSLKQKDLVGIPWRVAFALQADGWYLRSDIIWSKPNPMPESVTDRPTKAHEYVFLLSKSARYYWDQEALREPAAWDRWGDQTVGEGSNPNGWIKPHTKTELTRGPGNWGERPVGIPGEGEGRGQAAGPLTLPDKRNCRSVWEIATQPYPGAHFAVFPEELARRCILAGCPEGGTVLDPFGGSGTTALVARKHGRWSVLIEVNEMYCQLAAKRLQQLSLLADTP